jgi:enolase
MEHNMYASVSNKKMSQKDTMDQSDITYTLELLNDAIAENDWDKVEEARETLKEFLDGDVPPLEE